MEVCMNRYWYVECVGYSQVIELEASRVTLEDQDLLEVVQGGEVCLAVVKRKARELVGRLDRLKPILVAGHVAVVELSGFDIRIAETSAVKDLLIEIWRSRELEGYRFPIVQGKWQGVDVPEEIRSGVPSFGIHIQDGRVSPQVKPELRVGLIEFLRLGLGVESEDEIASKITLKFMPDSRRESIKKAISELAKIYVMADVMQTMSGAPLEDILFSENKAFWRIA
jgi:hypothetical protein